MKQKLYFWIEEYLFFPNNFQKIISFLLLPLTCIYVFIILIKRLFSKKNDFDIPIISIGNLVIGGTGKTPVTIKLASSYSDVAIILRGYGRKSKGLYVISNKGKILEDIEVSGDEAMLLSKALPKATIIVSEDRKKGILKAKELACSLVFLDDGFSKYKIKKFDILLRPKDEPTNIFCLPSGGYREPKGFYSYANLVLKEGIDFNRVVTIKKNNKYINFTDKTLLITAISKPKRLLEFLPKNTKIIVFPDHHIFIQKEINDIVERYQSYQMVCTLKDYVKLEKFNIPNLYLMYLDIEFNKSLNFSDLEKYISLNLKTFNKI